MQKKQRPAPAAHSSRTPSGQVAAAVATLPTQREQALGRLAVVLLALWAAMLGLTPVTANDIWLQMKVGADVLASGEFPTTEVYSATASGRPFIAYEWLSSVLFHVVGDGHLWGLSVLCALVYGGVFCLLYFALAPGLRARPWTLPMLALAVYLIHFRTQIRPHILSDLLLCGLVFVIERWRRDRKSSRLIVLPLVFVAWVNAHGAYMLGLALLAALTGAAACMWLLPMARRASEPGEPYTARQVRDLGLVTMACGLATLVNPYGYRIWVLSLEFAFGFHYFKGDVIEWRSPFAIHPELGQFLFLGWGSYWFHLYAVTVVGYALLALVRWRRVSLFDAGLLATSIYLSVTANRFVTYVPILGLAGAVRGVGEIVRTWRPQWERIDWSRVHAAGACLLIVLAGVWGYVYESGQYRPVGVGDGGRHPDGAIAHIKRTGLRGTVFNNFRDGCYIVHELYPDVRPVMDSRIDIYGGELFAEFQAAERGVPAFRSYLDKYDIDLVLLPRVTHCVDIFYWLDAQPRWKKVYEDPSPDGRVDPWSYVLYRRS